MNSNPMMMMCMPASMFQSQYVKETNNLITNSV